MYFYINVMQNKMGTLDIWFVMHLKFLKFSIKVTGLATGGPTLE